MVENVNINNHIEEEKVIGKANGAMVLITLLLMHAASIWALVACGMELERSGGYALAVWGLILSLLFVCLLIPLCYIGLKVVNPNEALVLVLFGKYYGTLRNAGFYWVNPFCFGINPAAQNVRPVKVGAMAMAQEAQVAEEKGLPGKKLSLKAMTLKNDRQKINDILGNPIEIGVNVVWQIKNTAKAVFNVDNFKEYLSIQCDSALRNIVRLYPYDMSEQGEEKSLRGSSIEVALMLKEELQSKAEIAGIEVLEAKITHLAYAPEIAAAMLQRQQAVAVIEARQKIVEGAVGMVEMALQKLSANHIVELDDERKAAMVSNLLVVLCGNKDAQPIVNSGSIY